MLCFVLFIFPSFTKIASPGWPFCQTSQCYKYMCMHMVLSVLLNINKSYNFCSDPLADIKKYTWIWVWTNWGNVGMDERHYYSLSVFFPTKVNEDIWCLTFGRHSIGYDIWKSLVIWLHFPLNCCQVVISSLWGTWHTKGCSMLEFFSLHTHWVLISAVKYIGRKHYICHPFLLFNK